jgi:hypothetical protein
MRKLKDPCVLGCALGDPSGASSLRRRISFPARQVKVNMELSMVEDDRLWSRPVDLCPDLAQDQEHSMQRTKGSARRRK